MHSSEAKKAAPGRNDPCPCGSGRKYKHCCGSLASSAPAAPPRAVQEMTGGLRVALPDSLDLMTPYVLQEQQDWFEDEIRFVRAFLQPGMRVVDIGANYGLYALSMARAVGSNGRVWAFEPASATASFLRESIEINGLANLTLVQSALSDRAGRARLFLQDNSELNSLSATGPSTLPFEEVTVRSLDELDDELGFGEVDFVKLDAEGEESRIVRGGRRLFDTRAPLVMFELMHGSQVNIPLLDQFAAIGYGTYRLLPGLGVLVPCGVSDPRDAFQLNLFACKGATAARLGQRGVLSMQPDVAAAVASLVRGAWRTALAPQPFAAAYMDGWAHGSALPGRDAYLDALDFYCLAMEPGTAVQIRHGALLESLRLLERACAAAPTCGRLSTHARALLAAGWRVQALDQLTAALHGIEAGNPVVTAEPFLPACERFEQLPRTRPTEWMTAALLEQLEHKRAWSSYHVADESWHLLQRIFSLGFATPALERRAALAGRRARLR